MWFSVWYMLDKRPNQITGKILCDLLTKLKQNEILTANTISVCKLKTNDLFNSEIISYNK